MTAFVLGALDLFQKAFLTFGINYEQLRSVVEVKLTMDNRRHIIGYRRRQSAEPKNTFFTTFLIYLLFGCFPGLMIMYFPSFTLSLIFFFSYLMMMITMTLVTDFSAVLLDTSDNTVLLPRPVDGRTLFVARIIHISAYLAQLTFGLSVAPVMAVGVFHKLPVLIAFLACIVLSVILAVAITNTLYLLILRFASEEKIKNIINYMQIGMTILVVGGYQLGPRMITRMENQSFDIDRWSLLIPPAWMTGMIEAFEFNNWDDLHAGLTVLAIGMPLTGIYLVNKYLSPTFARKLGSMETAGTQLAPRRISSGRAPLVRRLSNWFTTSNVEQSTFELVYSLIGRDRKIKLKLYPAFGYLLVFAGLFLVKGQHAFGAGDHFHLVMIYMIILVLQIVIYEIAYSDEYKAGWIFFAAPVANPGEILTGTLKAIFLRLFVPGYLFSTVVVLCIWGISADIVTDLVAGFLNVCIMLILLLIIKDHHIPFSLAPSMRSQSGRFARMLLTTFLMFALGFIHYLLAKWPQVLLAAIPMQAIVVYLLLRFYRSVPWKEIRS